VRALYNLGLLLLLPVLGAALAWRLLTRAEYRPHLAERFGAVPRSPAGKRVIWVHAVSVGEVISLVPLAHALRERFADAHLVLTCGTPTGRAMAGERLQAVFDGIAYLPYDLPPLMRRALRRIRPDLMLLLETELWPNLLAALRARRVPVVLANGRISDRSFPRYRRFRALVAPLLSGFSSLMMQTATDAERITALGAPAERVVVAGNLKYDQPVPVPDPAARTAMRAALGLDEDAPVLVAGSTHEGEETAVAGVFEHLARRFSGLRLVLAVRHPHRAEGVVSALKGLGIDAGRKSLGDTAGKPVVLLDTVGELAAHYRLATVAFIGGSLVPVGGHNPLEASACGVPVVYGPYTGNFSQPCQALEQAGAAVCAADVVELEAVLEKLLSDPDARHRMGAAGQTVFATHRGAAARMVERIAGVLE